MTQIVDVAREPETGYVRDLMRAFIAWHHERHADDLHLVRAYFDERAFEEELAGLPGKYASPNGALLLATVENAPAGCVALRRIDEARCEMKRMFVYPQFHGKGIGLALGEAVIARAKALGYEQMLLDSGAKQTEAHGLYRRLGFTDTAPYYELPQDLRDWLVFMRLDLRS
jgi:GNAT superfamily N-acetyltransferase